MYDANGDDYVSPYLKRPLRSLAEVLAGKSGDAALPIAEQGCRSKSCCGKESCELPLSPARISAVPGRSE